MSLAVISTRPSCMSFGCTNLISSIMSRCLSSTAHTSPSKSLRVTSLYFCVIVYSFKIHSYASAQRPQPSEGESQFKVTKVQIVCNCPEVTGFMPLKLRVCFTVRELNHPNRDGISPTFDRCSHLPDAKKLTPDVRKVRWLARAAFAAPRGSNGDTNRPAVIRSQSLLPPAYIQVPLANGGSRYHRDQHRLWIGRA